MCLLGYIGDYLMHSIEFLAHSARNVCCLANVAIDWKDKEYRSNFCSLPRFDSLREKYVDCYIGLVANESLTS